MPLDIQPLSATRRIVMVSVMIAILVASLGFAQVLINRKSLLPRPAFTQVDARFEPLPGATSPLPVTRVGDPHVRGVRTIPVRIGSATRRMAAIEFGSDSANVPTEWHVDAEQIFTVFTNAEPDEAAPIKFRETLLGGRPALEAIGTAPIGDLPGYAFICLTELDGQGIAVCFSGTGVPTKADIEYFRTYCLKGVTMQVVVTKKKG